MTSVISPNPMRRDDAWEQHRNCGLDPVAFALLLAQLRGAGWDAPSGSTNEQAPAPYGTSAWGTIRCIASTVGLLARGRLRLPADHVGVRLHFADGTSAPIYRETVVDGRAPADPCVLVVAFRLRFIRGRGHAAFRAESLLNTPLFVGYPGFVSKLWLAHDEHGVYRGVYEWDGPGRAEHYARSLWRVLALGSVPASIRYRVLPGLRRDDVLADPSVLNPIDPADDAAWWRLVDVS
jgi:hypothetical protein